MLTVKLEICKGHCLLYIQLNHFWYRISSICNFFIRARGERPQKISMKKTFKKVMTYAKCFHGNSSTCFQLLSRVNADGGGTFLRLYSRSLVDSMSNSQAMVNFCAKLDCDTIIVFDRTRYSE